MQVADEAGIGWSREIETAEVRSRIIQQFETATRDAKARRTGCRRNLSKKQFRF
jgi:hypothetical protein